jgi:predicted SnoaL-like aldol condensation-catalyzing enzyme
VTSVSERNKRKIGLFVEQVWNEGRLELVDELVAADYLGHISCRQSSVLGPEGVRRFVSSCRGAHPGLYIKIEDQVAEHDLVVTRWEAVAAAKDPRSTGAAIGSTRCCSGITIVRLLAGKQVDSHTGYLAA